MSPLLAVEDLHVRIGAGKRKVHAVRGVSFTVERGETLSIVGESGCGKSMTAFALMGLMPAGGKRTVRRLELAGTDLASLSERRLSDIRGSRMSIIFQDPMTALNPAYTVGNQLEEVYLRHKPGQRSAARDRVVYLLDRVGIGAAASRLRLFPHQLSGGLCQRVMIAMALICEPELIIADEATTALDVTIQAQILRLLRELQAEFNLSILLITHDMGVVARTADRVAVMYAGEFVETGTTEEVFRTSAHPYTQALLDAIPRAGRHALGSGLKGIPGVVPSLSAEILGCAFRDRCPHATERCGAGAVPFTSPAPGRGWRCLFPRRLADPAGRLDASQFAE